MEETLFHSRLLSDILFFIRHREDLRRRSFSIFNPAIYLSFQKFEALISFEHKYVYHHFVLVTFMNTHSFGRFIILMILFEAITRA